MFSFNKEKMILKTQVDGFFSCYNAIGIVLKCLDFI